MNHRLASILGSFVLGAIVFVAEPAAGQNGPYYPLPSWDQTLRAAKRFVLVMPIDGFGPQAVLDHETGLVWQRTPHEPREFEWHVARRLCRTENTGGRQGWRLPSVEELSSLLDLAPASSDPGLPSGHPFELRETSPVFWSASARQPLEDAVVILQRTLPADHPLVVSTTRDLERARQSLAGR